MLFCGENVTHSFLSFSKKPDPRASQSPRRHAVPGTRQQPQDRGDEQHPLPRRLRDLRPGPTRQHAAAKPCDHLRVAKQRHGAHGPFDEKPRNASTASMQRYVMLEQGMAGFTIFERGGADWLGRILDADAVIRMPEIGVEILLAELLDGIDLFNVPLDEDG